MVNEGISSNHGDTYLGAEFDFGTGFAADNGTDMRLENADNTVLATMSSCVEHGLLLPPHIQYSKEQLFVAPLQTHETVRGISGDQVKNRTDAFR